MKKLLLTAVFVLVGAASYLHNHIQSTSAAGGLPYAAKFSASPSSGVANGTSAVTVTVSTVMYRCSEKRPNPYGEPYYEYHNKPGYCEANNLGVTDQEQTVPNADVALTVSGSGNTVSASSIKTDGNGFAAFTIKSSVAETKTIVGNYVTNPTPGGVIGSTNLAFTAPAPPATTAPKPVAPKRIVEPSPAETAPPAVPAIEIRAGAAAVKPSDKPTLENGEALVLSGKTVSNGVVAIYVFSEPKKYTVTADKDGSWAYSVKDLPAGDHHIEAEVTDPVTGKTSSRAQVLSFTVAEKKPVVKESVGMTPTKVSGVPIAAILGVVILVIAVASAIWWKSKKSQPRARS